MRAHLNDPAWFQAGSYAKFARQARDILDGRQRLFWIDDPTRTDLVQYPPAFPAFLALIYKVSGSASSYTAQLVVWFLDLILAPLFIGGIAFAAFGWRTAMAACFLVGLSALFALYAAFPSADMPTTWFVLAGCLLLVLALRRKNIWLALAAGVALGIACWFRVNPLYLCVFWAIALCLVVQDQWSLKLKMGAAVLVGTLVVIAPIVIRNYIVFPDFTPTGGTIGVNLWEGLGETELGQQQGFNVNDDVLVETERTRMGRPGDTRIELQFPDGIRRDKERVRESLAFIRQRPIWQLRVMLGRMWGMLKVAGDPVPHTGISGINVTSGKCLPERWQSGVLAFGVNVLGMIQSVVRYLFLPLAALGLYVAARINWRVTFLMLATILYYLGPGTVGHTEIRYVLPMHGLLIVFAAVGVDYLIRLIVAKRG